MTNSTDGWSFLANAVKIGYSVIYFWLSNAPWSTKDKEASTELSFFVKTIAWAAVRLDKLIKNYYNIYTWIIKILFRI